MKKIEISPEAEKKVSLVKDFNGESSINVEFKSGSILNIDKPSQIFTRNSSIVIVKENKLFFLIKGQIKEFEAFENIEKVELCIDLSSVETNYNEMTECKVETKELSIFDLDSDEYKELYRHYYISEYDFRLQDPETLILIKGHHLILDAFEQHLIPTKNLEYIEIELSENNLYQIAF